MRRTRPGSGLQKHSLHINRSDTSHNQFLVNSWSTFSRYYDGIFSPEVRDAILESDFGELPMKYDGRDS